VDKRKRMQALEARAVQDLTRSSQEPSRPVMRGRRPMMMGGPR